MRTFGLITAIAFLVAISTAQPDPRSFALGKSAVIISRNIEAIGVNPALLAYMGYPREARLYGYAFDAQTKQPIPGVRVSIYELEIVEATNSSGRFDFGEIEPGKYTIIVSKRGYRRVQISGVKIRQGEVLSIGIPLTRRGRHRKPLQLSLENIPHRIVRYPTVIYNDKSHFALGLPQLGFKLGANFLTYQVYLDYFTGVDSLGTIYPRFLTDEDKRKLLDIFPGDKGTLVMNLDAKLLSLAFHIGRVGIAFGLRERVLGKVEIPRDFLRLVLYGNPPGSSYSFDMGFSGMWIRDISISTGFKLPIEFPFAKNINIGFGVKKIFGYGYLSTDSLKLTFETADTSRGFELTSNLSLLVKRSGIDLLDPDKKATFEPFPQPVGTGTGFDLGISAELFNAIAVGLSVTDIGSINWTKNAIITSGDTTVKFPGYRSEKQLDSLKSKFETLVNKKSYESFSTDLPTAFRLGFAVMAQKILPWFPGKMLITGEYYVPVGASNVVYKKPRFSLGAEWRLLGFLPLRGGISFGGIEGFTLSAGFGLDLSVLEFNFSTYNLNSLTAGNKFNFFSIATGIKLKI